MTDNIPKKKVNTLNQVVKESITEALLGMMKTKDFSDITVSELTKKAGVGRVSFYRNFDSKEDVLLKHMLNISNDYWKQNSSEDPDTLWRTTFEIFELLKPIAILTHRSHIDSILYTFIKKCTSSDKPEDMSEGYHRAIYTGIVFGLYDHWVSTGMKESAKELTTMFHNIRINL